MLYVNEKSWANSLFKNTQLHKEKTLSPGQQKALEVTGTDVTSGENDATLNEISAKLQNGMELSPSELEYLRVNAPDLYKEAVRMIELKKKIEERLEQCKSKEDVARAQSEISSQIAMECDVSPSKKCDISKAKMYERRINLAKNTFVKFAKTESFRNLPDTDSEYVRLKSDKMKENFGDKLEISKEGKEKVEADTENKKLGEAENNGGENAVSEAENEKKLETADDKKPKRKTFKELPVYTKNYEPLSASPSMSGFQVTV